MANKNTKKVKRRRERRSRERAMQDFLAFASKRQAVITIGTVCANGKVFCSHEGLTTLAMYSLKQAIENYTDCQLVPKLDTGGFRPFFKGEKVEVPAHKHEGDKDDSGLDSSLKHVIERENCEQCHQTIDERPCVELFYDHYENKFSKLFLEAYRDGAFSQLDTIRQVAGLDDQQWDYLLKHVAFSFTPNLDKSRSLVVIK